MGYSVGSRLRLVLVNLIIGFLVAVCLRFLESVVFIFLGRFRIGRFKLNQVLVFGIEWVIYWFRRFLVKQIFRLYGDVGKLVMWGNWVDVWLVVRFCSSFYRLVQKFGFRDRCRVNSYRGLSELREYRRRESFGLEFNILYDSSGFSFSYVKLQWQNYGKAFSFFSVWFYVYEDSDFCQRVVRMI